MSPPEASPPAVLNVRIRRLANGAGLELPGHATRDSAGVDLLAAVNEPLTLKPGERAMVPTGIALELPPGFEAQVRPRSGLAAKHGITVLNSPGTIDADYRGEVKVIMINLGDKSFSITRGTRIAQMVVAPVVAVNWNEVETLNESERGAGGFGSTGSAEQKVSTV